MSKNETSLGEHTTETLIESEPLVGGDKLGDETPLDLAAWIAGARPARRSVIIYARPDLQAEIDKCAELEMRTSQDQSDQYRQRAIDLTEQMLASGLEFVVEGRSVEWVRAFEKRCKKQGITDVEKQSNLLLAEQIVSPVGVTADFIAQLRELFDGQMSALFQAATDASFSAPKINPRFSRPA